MNLNPEDGCKGRIAQWFFVEHKGSIFFVLNMHGYWSKNGKEDTPERIVQSQNIIKYAKEYIDKNIPCIICGDFNLRPDTESVSMLEKHFRNLIDSHNIKNTRTSYYTRNEKFADYIFISPEINEKDFKCMSEEVSDHTALCLEI